MARSEPDERRWTLTRSHPMTTSFDGPRLALGESVDVVPDSQLARAVKTAEDLLAWIDTEGRNCPSRTAIDGLLTRSRARLPDGGR